MYIEYNIQNKNNTQLVWTRYLLLENLIGQFVSKVGNITVRVMQFTLAAKDQSNKLDKNQNKFDPPPWNARYPQQRLNQMIPQLKRVLGLALSHINNNNYWIFF